MEPLAYQVVDAFTQSPLKGNPAAVVLLDLLDPRASDDSFLLNVAREFNFSETAYLVPLLRPTTPTYHLRWFTPEVEFPLCGHATLASSHVLFTTHHPDASVLHFETMSGLLIARRMEGGSIQLDFPADAGVLTNAVEGKDLDKLVMGVRKACSSVERLDLEVVCYAKGELGWVVELSTNVDLEELKIDSMAELKELGGMVIFTQPGSGSADIHSRVFDPVERNPEDPVTGSAHCMLAPYWLGNSQARARLPARLISELDDTLLAKQVSARGGELEVVWGRAVGRIKLRGHAVTVMTGVLHV